MATTHTSHVRSGATSTQDDRLVIVNRNLVALLHGVQELATEEINRDDSLVAHLSKQSSAIGRSKAASVSM
jgi:hypothetical protein